MLDLSRAQVPLLLALFLASGCDGDGPDLDTDGGADLTDAGASSEDAGPAGADAGASGGDAGPDAGLSGDDAGPGGSDAGPGEIDAGTTMMGALPPANGMLDYQLGSAYTPPRGVVVVSRDREARPAPGIYNICYINGFQTQPGERSFWTRDHGELLLRDSGGDLVIDPDWDEIILDVTTHAKRSAVADIVGGWIDECAADGFDAIEIDNLDTYSRSGGRISQDDAVTYMRMLADRAHARGLPIAQKNSAEVLGRRADMGTDFAIAEECNRWNECGDFTRVYGDQVYVIEYRRGDFDRGCRDFPSLSIVLRDLNLVGSGSRSYVYDGC